MKKNSGKILSFCGLNGGYRIKSFCIENDKENNVLEILTTVKFKARQSSEGIVNSLSGIDGVRKVKCE